MKCCIKKKINVFSLKKFNLFLSNLLKNNLYNN